MAALSVGFDAMMRASSHLSISSRGALKRDRDTFFWSLFTDKFGSNPNTPYMWSALPLMGFLLPSPMFSLGPQDAVVMLSRYQQHTSNTLATHWQHTRASRCLAPCLALGLRTW